MDYNTLIHEMSDRVGVYHLILDATLTPNLDNASMPPPRYTQVAWSPPGLLHYGRCVHRSSLMTIFLCSLLLFLGRYNKLVQVSAGNADELWIRQGGVLVQSALEARHRLGGELDRGLPPRLGEPSAVAGGAVRGALPAGGAAPDSWCVHGDSFFCSTHSHTVLALAKQDRDADALPSLQQSRGAASADLASSTRSTACWQRPTATAWSRCGRCPSCVSARWPRVRGTRTTRPCPQSRRGWPSRWRRARPARLGGPSSPSCTG